MDYTSILKEIVDYCDKEQNYSYYDMKAYAYENKPEWIDALRYVKFRLFVADFLKSAQRKSGNKYKNSIRDSIEKCSEAADKYYSNLIEAELENIEASVESTDKED